jgi:hypothetical protein
MESNFQWNSRPVEDLVPKGIKNKPQQHSSNNRNGKPPFALGSEGGN